MGEHGKMIGQVLKRTPVIVMAIFVLLTATALFVGWRATAPLAVLTWVAEVKSPLSSELLTIRQTLEQQRQTTLTLIAETNTAQSRGTDKAEERASRFRVLTERQNQSLARIDRLLTTSFQDRSDAVNLSHGLQTRQSALSRAYGDFQDLARDLIDTRRLGDIATIQALLPELAVEEKSVQAAVTAFEDKLNATTHGLSALKSKARRDAFSVIGGAIAACLGIIVLFLVLPINRARRAYRLLEQDLETIDVDGPERVALPRAQGVDEPLRDNLHRLMAQYMVRDRLHETFGRHLPDAMIEAVAAHGGLAALEPAMVSAQVVSVRVHGMQGSSPDHSPANKAEAIAEIDTWLVSLAKAAKALRQNRTAQGAVMVLALPFQTPEETTDQAANLLSALATGLPKLRIRLARILGPDQAKNISLHLGLASGSVLMGVLGGEAGPRLRYDGDAIHAAMEMSDIAVHKRGLLVAPADLSAIATKADISSSAQPIDLQSANFEDDLWMFS